MARELHIVTHSHWDREWHQTFQQFRLRLVHLLDQVLDLLSADPALRFFTLDGQTIVLDDYLEIRPERRTELSNRIAEGRLLVGPWYVHPDEFLVSGESLVRNLLQGGRQSREFGGGMQVGYVPDQFGHIAQLPQILRGFGIGNSILWRGVDHAESGNTFTWESPDGSAVLAIALANGYNNAEHLPQSGSALSERLRGMARTVDAESAGASEIPLLLMHGGDHTIPQMQLPGALAEAREMLGSDYTLIESTLPRFIEAVQAEAAPSRHIRSELRSSRSAFLLPGVTSSRIWIKQRNAAAQQLLERQTEPLSTVAYALGMPNPVAQLRQAWRYLLQNHPHDSICGCSVDQVHHEMITRFDWSEQIATALRDEALTVIAAQSNTATAGAEDPRTLSILVYNGASATTRGIFTLSLRLAGDAASYELVDLHGQRVPHEWQGETGEPPTNVEMPLSDLPDRQSLLEQIDGNRVMGMGFQEISMRTVGATLNLELTVGDQALLSRSDIEQALLDAEELVTEAGCTKISAVIARSSVMQLSALVEARACSYTTLFLRPRAKSSSVEVVPATIVDDSLQIENENYNVSAELDTGYLTITDRKSGLRVGPVHVLHDEGEAGDLYTHYSPPIDTEVFTDPMPKIERNMGPLGSSLQIHHTMQIPLELDSARIGRSAESVSVPVHTTVTLLPDDTMVRFTVQIDNKARDHRIRVHATVPFTTDHAHAADSFGIVRRSAQPETDGHWAEEPVGTAPHQGFLAIHGTDGALMLAARGLPEYEILPQADGTTEVALTLLRSAGWLSRGDLPVRPADAGPPLPTPEAQCFGPLTAHYALAIGTDGWRSLLPPAHAYSTDLCAVITPCHEGTLPAEASLIAIQEQEIVLSSYKIADNGKGSILRIYNEGTSDLNAHITTLLPTKRITQVNLAEVDQEVLYDGTPTTESTVAIKSHQIVSLRLE